MNNSVKRVQGSIKVYSKCTRSDSWCKYHEKGEAILLSSIISVLYDLKFKDSGRV